MNEFAYISIFLIAGFILLLVLFTFFEIMDRYDPLRQMIKFFTPHICFIVIFSSVFAIAGTVLFLEHHRLYNSQLILLPYFYLLLLFIWIIISIFLIVKTYLNSKLYMDKLVDYMEKKRPRCKDCKSCEKKGKKHICKKFSTKTKDWVIDPEAFIVGKCFEKGKPKMQTKV